MIPKSLTHRLEDVFKWAIPPRNPCIFDPKQSGGASNPSNDLTWRGPGEVELHPGRLTAGTYSHHPFRKENDLPNLHDYVPAVNLPGCIWLCPQWFWTLFGVPIFHGGKFLPLMAPQDVFQYHWRWYGGPEKTLRTFEVQKLPSSKLT